MFHSGQYGPPDAVSAVPPPTVFACNAPKPSTVNPAWLLAAAAGPEGPRSGVTHSDTNIVAVPITDTSSFLMTDSSAASILARTTTQREALIPDRGATATSRRAAARTFLLRPEPLLAEVDPALVVRRADPGVYEGRMVGADDADEERRSSAARPECHAAVVNGRRTRT